jgi:hypothetical protein
LLQQLRAEVFLSLAYSLDLRPSPTITTHLPISLMTDVVVPTLPNGCSIPVGVRTTMIGGNFGDLPERDLPVLDEAG